MLTIRAEQLEAFEQAAMSRFEDEMASYSKELTPKLCHVLGDAQLRVALRQAFGRAGRYGFTYRGPIRIYIELMFFCGSDFDTDPQFPAIGKLLRSSAGQMDRAEQIHAGYIDYLDNVAGPHNINVRKGLEAISAFARNPPIFSSDHLETTILREMSRAFPARAAFSGEAGLLGLVQEARDEARSFGLATPRDVALLATLKFAFGHGCAHDPLYPWISGTLADARIISANARSVRLERKAITWLNHVLARPREGAQA